MDISFYITDENIQSLKKLDDLLASTYADLKNAEGDEREALHHYARVSMIGASTRIENALLTDVEVSWLDTLLTEDGKTTAFLKNKELIENKLSKDRERSFEEVAGCRALLMHIYENHRDFFSLSESQICFLHHELLSPYQGASHHAGQYKTQPNSVIEQNKATGTTRTVFKTADAGPITKAAMHDLVEWYNKNLPLATWPLLIAVEFTYRFLAIHPFQDGNGRLGRGLFLLTLLNSQSEIISFVSRFLAIDRYIEKHKQEYYFVLNQCSGGTFKQDPHDYKIQYFLNFMMKILTEAIAGLDVPRQKFQAEQNLSASASQVLACFRDFPELRLTTQKIIDETGLPRRTVNYALTTLLKHKLIQKYGQKSGVRYQITF